MLNREKKLAKQAEAERIKRLEEEQKEQLDILVLEIQKLKEELAVADYEREEANRNKEILSNLYENEIIDNDGNVIQK